MTMRFPWPCRSGKRTSRKGLFILILMHGILSTAYSQYREELAKNPELFLRETREKLMLDDPALPQHIVGPIYFVGTKGLGIWLITSSLGNILINTGMPGTGPLIEASIRQLGFKTQDLKILLACHAHNDHVGTISYFKKLSSAKVALMKGDVDVLESGGRTDFFYGNVVQAFGYDSVKVDMVLRDKQEIQLGDVKITVRNTPGHTKGSTTFIVKVFDNNKPYTVVFPDGVSINPGYQLIKNPSYHGITGNYKRSFDLLESLEPDIWLAPHSEVFDFASKSKRAVSEGVKAWVDPEGYKKWLLLQKGKFEAQLLKEKNEIQPLNKPRP